MAVSADEIEDSVAFRQRAQITFPLLSDPELEAVAAWGVAMKGADIAVPTVYIINGQGRITWRHQSETQYDRPAMATMREQVTKALQK